MHDQIHTDISAKFTNMSILCAFMVVCMHVGGLFEKGTVGWYVTEITRGGLSRMAVPYFFLASGFFLAGHVGEQGWWSREVRKRIGTLLTPLVIWCLIGTVWGAFWTACANYLAGRPLGYDIPFCNGEWVPGVGILWFIRNLFLLVLVSKAIAWMIERIGWVWIGVCFAIYWSVYTCFNPVQPNLAWQEFLVYGFSLEGLTYFSTGMILRMTNIDLLIHSWRIGIISAIAGMGGLIFSLWFNLRLDTLNWYPIVNLRHFCLPFLIMAFWLVMPVKHPWTCFAGVAFPVYILHPLANVPVTIFLKRLTPLNGTASYLCKWLIAFVVCVVFARVVRRLMPNVFRIVFGGR